MYYDPRDVARADPLCPLSEETLKNVTFVKAMGNAFHEGLSGLPQSAEMTLAKRKAEEAIMWAVKALTA